MSRAKLRRAKDNSKNLSKKRKADAAALEPGAQRCRAIAGEPDTVTGVTGEPNTATGELGTVVGDVANSSNTARIPSTFALAGTNMTGMHLSLADDLCCPNSFPKINHTPSVSLPDSMGLGHESPASPVALDAEYDRPVPSSPASRHALACVAGSSCRQGDGCARHPNLSAFYRRIRDAKSLKAKADNEGNEDDEPEPADAGLPLQRPNSQDQIDFPAVLPQVVESRARTPTLPDDESTGELEPADAEPRLQPQSPCSAASGRGVDPQQRSGSCRLSQRDHRGDSVQTSDPEHRRPLVPDDGGEQNEDGSVVSPQAQESRAGMQSLSGDESSNERELANTEPSMQPTTSQGWVNLQHNIGRRRRRRRRRRRCDTDDEEDCSPIVGSDAKQGKDEDVVRPPRGKRRRLIAITFRPSSFLRSVTRLSASTKNCSMPLARRRMR